MISEGRRWLVRGAYGLACAGWLWTLVGLGIVIFDDVRTIMWSGPVLGAVGLVSLILALAGRAWWTSVGAGMMVVFPVGVFLMIYLLRLSPEPATLPVELLAVVFWLACIVPGVLGWGEPREKRVAWACERCGYWLIGLTEARCPECGEACDLEQVARAWAASGGLRKDEG
jgi:hypothetical protein